MKSLLGKLGVLFIGLLILGNAEVWGADWKFYGGSEFILAYYDAQSIIRPSENVVRVWVKWDYKEKGVMDMVGRFGKKYENLSHSKNSDEINCVEKKIHFRSADFYDNKGELIHSFSDQSSAWVFITPKSMNEILYKEVCK
jgi:hypothetical protein